MLLVDASAPAEHKLLPAAFRHGPQPSGRLLIATNQQHKDEQHCIPLYVTIRAVNMHTY